MNQRVLAAERTQIVGDLRHKQHISPNMVGYIDDMIAQFNLFHMSGHEEYPEEGADIKKVVAQIMLGGDSVFEFKKDKCIIYAITQSGTGSTMSVTFVVHNYGHENKWILIPTMLKLKIHLWVTGSSDYMQITPLWQVSDQVRSQYIHWTSQLADYVIRSCYEIGKEKEVAHNPSVSLRKQVSQLIDIDKLADQYKNDKVVLKAFEIEQSLLSTGAIPGRDYSMCELVTSARKELKEP
jgi:hypothetical protein